MILLGFFFIFVLNFYISEFKKMNKVLIKKLIFCLSNDEINRFYKKNNFFYEIFVKGLVYIFILIYNIKLLSLKK